MHIEVDALVKSYRGQTVVSSVSFSCEPGTVTGFLGPNGAGKSTVMKMMTGLVSPDSGRATFEGLTYRETTNPGSKIGVMLDASTLHPGRTGRETLTLASKHMGLSAGVVDRALEKTGTADAAKARLKTYSLGMRQRLGLGLALLGDPRVLILDEPFNGLDPYGVKWMSDTIRSFAHDGGTVLLSSHMLKEVEETADVALVLQAGSITANHNLRKQVDRTECEAVDPVALRVALRLARISFRESAIGVTAEARPEEVGEACLQHGVALKALFPANGRLETVFMDSTIDRKLATQAEQRS